MVILNHVQNKYRTANNQLKIGELPVQLGQEFFDSDYPQKLIFTLQADVQSFPAGTRVCKTAEYQFIDYQKPILAIGFSHGGSDLGIHHAKIEISNFCREVNATDTRFHPYYSVCPRNINEEFVTYFHPRNESSCDDEMQQITGGFCPMSLSTIHTKSEWSNTTLLYTTSTTTIPMTTSSTKTTTVTQPSITQLELFNPRFVDDSYYGDSKGFSHYDPMWAVDGDWMSSPGNMAHSSASFDINQDPNNLPTFHVDLLGGTKTVEKVIIYPRNANCCFNRYEQMTVRIGENESLCSPETVFTADIVQNSINDGLKWNCNFVRGNSIEVINQDGEGIQIVEIVAYGY